MLFFRIFQHLLPDSPPWRLALSSTLRKFFVALSDSPQRIREFADLVLADAFPSTTREIVEWEKQFGLTHNSNESAARLALAAEWASGGGQSPHYIQAVLRTAGFDVYVHEWWESGPPYVARDPRDYTDVALFGSWQCADDADQPQCSGYSLGVPLEDQPQCDAFLANDPHYIVNKDLTPRAPPPVPADSATWPFFIYIGAETFPDHASLPEARRDEFERLILKLRPSQNWIVTLIDYVPSADGIFDDTFDSTFG